MIDEIKRFLSIDAQCGEVCKIEEYAGERKDNTGHSKGKKPVIFPITGFFIVASLSVRTRSEIR